MTTITLTKWWEAFKSDLERLAPKLLDNQSIQWRIAEDLIREGLSIETNLMDGLAIRKQMDALAQTLHHHYNPQIKPEATRFLPGIKSPDDFLLVLLFRNHLKRYETIKEGNFLVLRGINQELPLIQEDIKELEGLLKTYCEDKENQEALHRQFILLQNQPGQTVIEQMEHLLAEPTLEEKIAKILGAEGRSLMEAEDVLQQPQIFFECFKDILLKKQALLQEMAYCKELIELLEDNNDVPLDDLLQKNDNGTSLVRTKLWQQLVERASMSTFQGLKQAAKRTTTHLMTSPLRVASSITSWVSQKNVLPTRVNEALSSGASLLDTIDKGIKPLTVASCKKNILLSMAETHLKELGHKFSDNPSLGLSLKAVKEQSANTLQGFAKKLTLDSTLDALQRTLDHFEHTYYQGLIKVSQESIFGLLTEFFTKTLLKPLLNDTVLLLRTSKKLKQKLEILQTELCACEDEEEIQVVEAKTSSLLENTKHRAEKITKNSLYLFFRESNEKASKQLQQVMDAVSMRNI